MLAGRRVFDLGDLGAVPIDPRVGRAAYYRALTGLVDRLTRTRAVPLFIGGDHSLSAPVVTGLAAVHGPVRVVCFDAHCDFGARPMPGVTDITHGDFLGHLFQTGAVTACELYGVRTLLPASCGPLPADLRCTYAYGFPEPADTVEDEPVHLSIDLDVIDPMEFPATGHPEAGATACGNCSPRSSTCAVHAAWSPSTSWRPSRTTARTGRRAPRSPRSS